MGNQAVAPREKLVEIDKIAPYPRNQKKHSPEQIGRVADSIKEFGFNQPIVVDRNNEIIVGHCRYEAAKLLGMETVPVVKLPKLTPQQVRAYRLADNKLNESDWDMKLVVDELRSLDEEGFDINLTGFNADLLIDEDEGQDDVPESAPPIAKLGDVFKIGPHRVMCGDATNPDHVAKLMGEVRADMVFTDPPYNINYKGQGKNTSNTIENDNLQNKQFEDFLHKVFRNYADFTKAGAGNYVFHASRTQASFERAMAENGYEIKNQLIWNKPMAALGWGDYQWKHEPFFYAGKKGKEIRFFGDRTHSTVWDFQKSDQELLQWAKAQKRAENEGRTTIWSMKREPVQGYLHPTQKPVDLICYAILNSSKAGDAILDLFVGSGSTLIAADRTGRACYAMDLDPKYVDITIERYKNYKAREAAGPGQK